ncbi:Fur family transcriptional regulator [Piscicoccus intestinalis]|uniref:Fur family transcriptional regulator n=1 Tax=Piscicoccus intestinalis TaxID=746033 RepID=UPI000839AA33|nr:Fur family transcriptional regulator [Piscicoccus intestinalis]
MTTTPPEAAALLRNAYLRVTRPRTAVIDELYRHPHTDADDVATAVRLRLGKVSRQAIYDVLHALTDARIVRRIEPAGSPALYELHTGDNHHHLVCRRCGRLADVDCAVGEAPCLEPSQTHGFEVDEAEVVFWGLCPECLAADATPP